MAQFIYIGGGYVNLDSIDRVERKHDGKYRLFSKGELIDDNNAEFDRCIVSMIPITDEWECHFFCDGDEMTADTIVSEPIIAWGRTADGDMKPITPGEPDGVNGDYVISRLGSSRVYAGFGGNIGGWKDLNEWLQYIAASRKATSVA